MHEEATVVAKSLWTGNMGILKSGNADGVVVLYTINTQKPGAFAAPVLGSPFTTSTRKELTDSEIEYFQGRISEISKEISNPVEPTGVVFTDPVSYESSPILTAISGDISEA